MGLIQPWMKRLKKQKLIEEGDSDAVLAHYCLHKLHLLPSEFVALDPQEKAFVIASIKIKMEAEKRKLKE